MSAQAPRPLDLDDESGTSVDRLISLCDGIFAFSMTLLAVNVALPGLGEHASEAQVLQQVQELVPNFAFYATSFLLVGLYWQVNRRVFRYIKTYDTALGWLTILQLMFVAFLPVATGLFDSYAEIPVIIQIYSGTLLIIGIIGSLLWRHAVRAHLIDPTIEPERVRYLHFRGICTNSVYLGMFLASFVIPGAARWVLLAFLPMYPFMQRFYFFIYRNRPAPPIY